MPPTDALTSVTNPLGGITTVAYTPSSSLDQPDPADGAADRLRHHHR